MPKAAQRNLSARRRPESIPQSGSSDMTKATLSLLLLSHTLREGPHQLPAKGICLGRSSAVAGCAPASTPSRQKRA